MCSCHRFVAHVVKVRQSYPRIHVHFERDENGNTHKLALPEMSTCLSAADVRPLHPSDMPTADETMMLQSSAKAKQDHGNGDAIKSQAE